MGELSITGTVGRSNCAGRETAVVRPMALTGAPSTAVYSRNEKRDGMPLSWPVPCLLPGPSGEGEGEADVANP
jgi:hypothetical protein